MIETSLEPDLKHLASSGCDSAK